MVDWPGLLKWSLSINDGTTESVFQPLDEERRKWLQEALSTIIVDEVQRLKECCKALSTPESGDDNELPAKLNAIEELEMIIENMEAGRNMVKVGKLPDLIRAMLGSMYPQVRRRSTAIFSSAVQNNPQVQKAALEDNALEGIIARIVNEQELALKEAYVGGLSALVRGEYVEAKTAFFAQNGTLLIKQLLEAEESMRICKKLALLLTDLFYWDTKDPGHGFSATALENGLIQTILDRFVTHGDLELRELILKGLRHPAAMECPARDLIQVKLIDLRSTLSGDELELFNSIGFNS